MINRFVLIYLQGHLHLIVTIVWHKKVKALPTYLKLNEILLSAFYVPSLILLILKSFLVYDIITDDCII